MLAKSQFNNEKKGCLLAEEEFVEFVVRVPANVDFLSLHSELWLLLVSALTFFLLRATVQPHSPYRADEQICMTNSIKLS